MPATFDDLTPAQQETAQRLPIAGGLLAVMLSDLIERAVEDLPEALTEFNNRDTYDYIAELTDGEFVNETVATHFPGLNPDTVNTVRGICRSVLQAMVSMTWPLDGTAAVLAARDAAARERARIDAVYAENRAAAAASDDAGFGRIVDGLRMVSDV